MTSTINEANPLPCPFCGKQPIDVGEHDFTADSCVPREPEVHRMVKHPASHCLVNCDTHFSVEFWNKRIDEENTQLRNALDEIAVLAQEAHEKNLDGLNYSVRDNLVKLIAIATRHIRHEKDTRT